MSHIFYLISFQEKERPESGPISTFRILARTHSVQIRAGKDQIANQPVGEKFKLITIQRNAI